MNNLDPVFMTILILIVVVWYVITYVQMFLSYGTAYRWAKGGGDNGLSLFGWMLVFGLASCIPGLGLYLWFKYRYLNSSLGICPRCGNKLPSVGQFCNYCGNQFR
ncbi:MAG: zinc ribbon domain-containing protein [Coriobacteriales bacterium]|nr:zinc ribbon domain-containing protein [Coriobacteriales bacterium]